MVRSLGLYRVWGLAGAAVEHRLPEKGVVWWVDDVAMSFDKLGELCGSRVGLSVVACLLMVSALGFWFSGFGPTAVSSASVRTTPTDPGCDPGSGACTVVADGGWLALRFTSPALPLQPFPLEVSMEGIAADVVSVEFRMEGMQMGINRIELSPGSANVWRGEAVLPVCWTGRRRWTALVTLISDGGELRAGFGFMVDS